jgi:hypothetical protein
MLQNRLAYTEKADTFTFDWSPQGEKANTKERFEWWLQNRIEDDEVQKQFSLKKTAVALAGTEPTTRYHLWDSFNSLSDFKKSPTYQELIALMEVSDNNAKATPAQGTYPFFLALLNWSIYSPYARPLNPGTARKSGPLLDQEKSSLLLDVAEVLNIDFKNFDGWERWMRIMMGSPEDQKAIAFSQKIFDVGVNDRTTQRVLVPITQVVDPADGKTRTFRPLPVTLEGVTDPNFDFTDKAKSEWLAKTKDHKNYTLLRPNHDNHMVREGEEVPRQPFFEVAATISQGIYGESDIQRGYGGKLERAHQFAKNKNVKPFGRDYPLSDNEIASSGNKKTIHTSVQEMMSFANSSGVFVSNPEEVTEVGKIYNALTEFIQTAQQINHAYYYESKVTLKEFTQPYPVEWDRLELLHKMLKTFANQEEISYLSDFNSPKSVEEAILEAQKMARARLLQGQTDPEKKKHLVELMGVFQNYYQKKMQVLAYWRNLVETGENIKKGLSQLCDATDLKDVRTEEQFEAAKPRIREVRMQYFTGLREFLNENAPVTPTVETRQLLDELINEPTDSEKWKQRLQYGVYGVIAFTFLLAAFEGPALAAAMGKLKACLSLRNLMIKLAFYWLPIKHTNLKAVKYRSNKLY